MGETQFGAPAYCYYYTSLTSWEILPYSLKFVMVPKRGGVNVTIAVFGNVNEYIIGSFSDTLIQTVNNVEIPRKVSCTFKVKRIR